MIVCVVLHNFVRLDYLRRRRGENAESKGDCKGDRDSIFHAWLPFVDLDVGPIMKIRHLHVNNASRSFARLQTKQYIELSAGVGG